MANIFISHSNKDKSVVYPLIECLNGFNHEVTSDISIKPGDHWLPTLTDYLKKADIVLVLISKDSVESEWIMQEISSARSYIDEGEGQKILIPVLLDGTMPPMELQDIQPVNGNGKSVDEIAREINLGITSFYGKKIASEEKSEKRQERILRSSADYIELTINQLSSREEFLSKRANTWYLVGYFSIIVGIIAAIGLSFFAIHYPFDKTQWYMVAFLGFKGMIVIVLLIAASKYSFNLAKSYMAESLKNSDRIHAISFGKFYLQAFDSNVKSDDIKDVFQHWNISGSTTFSDLDSEKFDPQLIEAIVKISDVLKKPAKDKKK